MHQHALAHVRLSLRVDFTKVFLSVIGLSQYARRSGRILMPSLVTVGRHKAHFFIVHLLVDRHLYFSLQLRENLQEEQTLYVNKAQGSMGYESNCTSQFGKFLTTCDGKIKSNKHCVSSLSRRTVNQPRRRTLKYVYGCGFWYMRVFGKLKLKGLSEA